MRRYHFKVTLLTLGMLFGFGSAIAHHVYGYPMGPGCHGWHHGHHGYQHHHDCDCDSGGQRDEPAPNAPGGVQSGKT
jgi:hypothetical protein